MQRDLRHAYALSTDVKQQSLSCSMSGHMPFATCKTCTLGRQKVLCWDATGTWRTIGIELYQLLSQFLEEPLDLNSFDPPVARKFAWRQLELMEKGMSRKKAEQQTEEELKDELQ